MNREPRVGDVIVEYTQDFKEVYLVFKVQKRFRRGLHETLIHTLCWSPFREKKPDIQVFDHHYFKPNDRVLIAENVGKHPANLLELERFRVAFPGPENQPSQVVDS